MTSEPVAGGQSPVPPRKKGFGCFGWGCLITVVLSLILVGGGWFFYDRAVRPWIDEKTQDLAALSRLADGAQELAETVESGGKSLGNTDPAAFPQDVPKPAAAKTAAFNTTSESDATAWFVLKSPVEQVAKALRRDAEAQGWKLRGAAPPKGRDALLRFEKDDRQMKLDVVETFEGEVEVFVQVSPRPVVGPARKGGKP